MAVRRDGTVLQISIDSYPLYITSVTLFPDWSTKTNKQKKKKYLIFREFKNLTPLLRSILSLVHSRKWPVFFLVLATRQFSLLKVMTGLEERTWRHLMRSTLTAALQQRRINRSIWASLGLLFELKLGMWSKWSLRTMYVLRLWFHCVLYDKDVTCAPKTIKCDVRVWLWNARVSQLMVSGMNSESKGLGWSSSGITVFLNKTLYIVPLSNQEYKWISGPCDGLASYLGG